MVKKKGLYVILAVLILLGAGGYVLATFKPFSAQAKTTQTPVQTAEAFTGSVAISASGMGTVIAAEEASVGFYSQGVVGEILVKVGDEVSAGDVLARQGNMNSLELAVTNAELQLAIAQNALQAIYDNYDTDLADAGLAVVTAQAALKTAQKADTSLSYGRCNEDLVDEYYDAYVAANREYNSIKDQNVADSVKQDFADALQAAWSNYNFCITPYTEVEVAEGDANLSVAEAAYKVALAEYQKLQAGVDEYQIKQAQAAVAEAEYNLSVATDALKGATVTAPIAGTVMAIDASVGDTVSSPFLTINQTRPITLSVMLDETDLNSVEVGYEVEVVFDAFEGQTFSGHITLVNPGLSSMGASGVVSAEAVLDEDSYAKPQSIPIGMNATVSVINARADDAVLVPIEALVSLGSGQYAVFVMEKGTPRLQEVQVGLQNGTYAAITGGLQAGEVVTTGIVKTH